MTNVLTNVLTPCHGPHMETNTAAVAEIDPFAGWSLAVTHFADMPCIMGKGDRRTDRPQDVTCAACYQWVPQVPGRCDHARIVPMSRPMQQHVVNPQRREGYEWHCPTCGHKAYRLLENTPKRWLAYSDNRERLVAIEAQIKVLEAGK